MTLNFIPDNVLNTPGKIGAPKKLFISVTAILPIDIGVINDISNNKTLHGTLTRAGSQITLTPRNAYTIQTNHFSLEGECILQLDQDGQHFFTQKNTLNVLINNTSTDIPVLVTNIPTKILMVDYNAISTKKAIQNSTQLKIAEKGVAKFNANIYDQVPFDLAHLIK